MINTSHFIHNLASIFKQHREILPWYIAQEVPKIILEKIQLLGKDFNVKNNIAIHSTAIIEKGAIIKAPAIIEENCFIGANSYLRGGVYLGKSSKIGPFCEIKSSLIFNNTSIAHFNFIGDSIIGNHVNFEAGAVTANHYNERTDKTISVKHHNNLIKLPIEKFGSLVGDYSKIGANAVLSPGTLLEPKSIVKRLELVEQV